MVVSSLYAHTDGWMDGRMDGWMDAWMHGCMDGWMDTRIGRPEQEQRDHFEVEVYSKYMIYKATLGVRDHHVGID